MRGTPPVSPTSCSGATAPAIGRRSLSNSPRTPRRSFTAASAPSLAGPSSQHRPASVASAPEAPSSTGSRSSGGRESHPEGPAVPPCAGCAERERALREAHLEIQRLREQLQQRDEVVGKLSESVRPSSSSSCCPRCCRSAVGGAVHALMDGMLGALGDALPLDSGARAAAGAGDWREVADEIWGVISVKRPGSAETAAAVAELPSLVPLRGLLQEAATTAAAAAGEDARPAEPSGHEDVRPRPALAEIPWWNLQENSGCVAATTKSGTKAPPWPAPAARPRGQLEPSGDRRAPQVRPFSFLR